MRLRWYSCPKCQSRLKNPIAVYSEDRHRLTGIQYYCSCGWAVVELPHMSDLIAFHRWKQGFQV